MYNFYKNLLIKIAYILFAVLHMHPLLGQNVNDIDKDPHLRNWLFIGPFKDKNIAKEVSDSLITLNNSDIIDYVNKRDDLSSYFITSKAPSGTHSVYQYFPESNEEFIIGLCQIMSGKNQVLYYKQNIHKWDELSFKINDNQVVDDSNKSIVLKKVNLAKGKNPAALLLEVKPFALNAGNEYYNNFRLGLFKDSMITDISGTVSFKNKVAPNVKVILSSFEGIHLETISDSIGYYTFKLINRDKYSNLTISVLNDELVFHENIKLINSGDDKLLNINLKNYNTEIFGKVTTLFVEKPQPDVIVSLIDAISNETILQTISDNSGLFSFSISRIGSYKLMVNSLQNKYFAKDDNQKDLIVNIGRGSKKVKNIEIKSSLIHKGSWKQLNFIKGLKSNNVQDIFTDSKNRTWYACHTGITVFDGNEFIEIGSENNLPVACVNQIFEDSKGQIFAALRNPWNGFGGLFLIDDNYFAINYLEKIGVKPFGIEVVKEDGEKNLVFSGWMGMYVYDGKKVKHFRYGDGMASGQVLDILIDQGNYWLATTDGFVHYTNNNFINYNINQQKLSIRKIFKSPKGDLIVSPISGRSSNYEYGLYRYNGFKFEPVNVTKFNKNIRDVVFQDNNLIYSSSEHLIIHDKSGYHQSYSPRWSLNKDMSWIQSLEKTRDGNLIVGTWESGAWIYDSESINIINDVNGINSWLTGGVVDKNDNLWVSTGDDGIYKIRKDKIIREYRVSDGLPSNKIRKLDLDNFGNIWGVSDKGLFSISDSTINIYDKLMGFVSNDMYNIKVDNKNTIWVSGEGFLSSFESNNIKNFSRTNDSTRFWGYNAGLFILDNGNILHGGANLKLFELTRNGYTFETLLKDNWINGIQQNSKGAIYYSDAYNGIVKVIDNKKVDDLALRDGFMFDEPTTVYIDDKDWIWSASQSGGVGFFDGEVWSYLNTEDGLFSDNVWGINSDSKNNYYFLHRMGITRYSPKKSSGSVVINTVSTSTEDYSENNLTNIKSLVNERIRISFATRNTNHRSGKDNFIYNVSSDNWNLSGTTTDPFLVWYPPIVGDYTLEVKSVDRDLNHSDMTKFKISVINPWYLRSIYLYPSLSFFLIIIYITFSSTTRYLKQKKYSENLRLENQEKDKEARKALELKNKELLDSQKAAEAANEAKSTFLANMSHELRTPLNAIIGYSEMLIEDAEDENEDFVPDLDKINSSGKHLLGLINDILDLSKVESGKMELFIEKFNLEKVLKEIVSTIRPLAEKNKNVLKLSINTMTKEISADVTKIRQIMLNLLSNATKFTKEGEINITVEDNLDNNLLLDFKVSDSGIGMTQEQIDKVFKPFTQADEKTTRKFGGTGLGLTITKMFSEMMGGSVTIKSIINEGTTFEVTIPKIVVDNKNIETEIKNVAHSNLKDSFSVLVIDDDPNAQELMKKFLIKENYSVLQATSGSDGIDLASKYQPDLITLDVMMPEMDGWEVLSSLQRNDNTKNIPVIMLTMANEPDIGYSLGATDYLTKPVDWAHLSKILEKHDIETKSQSILIVEDDEVTREMLKKSLETNKFKVVTAINGKDGLDRVKKAKPALILLDLMMPEMDGFEFAERLRENKEWLDVPVVVITAKDLSKEDHKRLKGNVEAIMQKGSYTRDELLNEVGQRIKILKEKD